MEKISATFHQNNSILNANCSHVT